MRGRVLLWALTLTTAVAFFVAPTGAAERALAQPAPTTTVAPPPPPKAWVLADADTGVVIDGANARQALPPASLTKVVTALAATDALESTATVPVTARAAAMPARKVNVKEGEVWPLHDALHALLLSSANDAAAALAERAGGSVEGFADVLSATASRLGLEDRPMLQDAAGLDDEFSVGGGNLISARDLAIAARAVLDDPVLAPIVATKEYSFTDPSGMARRLVNHNKLLWNYEGTVGMKTGYTRRAGHCLLAVATRGGRTMIAVVLGATADTYGWATRLLDQGFATPAVDVRAGGRARGLDVLTFGEATTVHLTPGADDPPGMRGDADLGALASSDAGAGRSPLALPVWLMASAMGTVTALRIRVRVRRARRARRRRST